MRDMISAMLAANVPVAFHVAPAGARAASAGTYLLYASHVAAMRRRPTWARPRRSSSEAAACQALAVNPKRRTRMRRRR